MVSLFSSPWPGSLNQLKDELLNQRIKVSAMFDPEGTGSIKIDDLFLVALLNALPDKHFSYPKDKIFAENTANTIPDFFRTLETMTNFDNYKTTLSHDSATPSTPAGPTALAAVAPSTSTSTCVMCQKQFPTIISRESQRPFRYCYTCNKKRRDTPDGTATATSSNPPARPPTIPPVARTPTQNLPMPSSLLPRPKIRPSLRQLQSVHRPSIQSTSTTAACTSSAPRPSRPTRPRSSGTWTAPPLSTAPSTSSISSTLSSSPNLFQSVALTVASSLPHIVAALTCPH